MCGGASGLDLLADDLHDLAWTGALLRAGHRDQRHAEREVQHTEATCFMEFSCRLPNVDGFVLRVDQPPPVRIYRLRMSFRSIGDRRRRNRSIFEESSVGRAMIRKLASGGYRLYSKKIDPRTGRRKNLGTFKTRAAAEKHERAVQFFKRRG